MIYFAASHIFSFVFFCFVVWLVYVGSFSFIFCFYLAVRDTLHVMWRASKRSSGLNTRCEVVSSGPSASLVSFGKTLLHIFIRLLSTQVSGGNRYEAILRIL